MKTIKSLLITGLLVSGFLVTGCKSNDEIISINEAEDIVDVIYKTTPVVPETSFSDSTCFSSFPIEELNETEIAALSSMREEELLARDIYMQLYEIYHYPVFNFIAKSETWHAGIVKYLIERYQLTDPASTHEIGIFTNTDIQALYDALLNKGKLSGTDALQVGATIEDLDIFDLQNLLTDAIDNQDINCAFQNLMKGSRNHMRSFVRVLSFGGNEYIPQYLSQEEFNQIINSPHEAGPVYCTN